VKLLTIEGLAARFGQAGRRRIEDRFTLDRHLAEMEQIYRDARSSGTRA
jgi:glycosyltransferase involved in cell wall biosynthesis